MPLSALSLLGSKIKHALGFSARDPRSHRIVAVIECILNQNARDRGAATYRAINHAVLQLCQKHEVGVLQIACPEMQFLGLRRQRPARVTLRACLDTSAGQQCCQRISHELADRFEEYIKNGCQIVAILGGNPESPGCAIHHQKTCKGEKTLADNSGILMLTLHVELRKRGLDIPFVAVRDHRPELLSEDLVTVETLFRASRR